MWVWREADKLDGRYYCGTQEQKIVVRNGLFDLRALTEYTPEIFETITIKPASDNLREAANQPFQLMMKQGDGIPVRPITFY